MSVTTSTRGVTYTKHLDLTQTREVYESPIQNWSFLYEVSTTRNPEYHVGDRVVLPDGRVFRYAKVGQNRTSGYAFSFYSHKFAGSGDSTSSDVTSGAIAVGDMSFKYTVESDQGYDYNGSVAKDELRGGYVVILGSTPAHQFRGIVGNTASAAGGEEITIYVDAAFNVAADTAQTLCIWYNPYNDVRQLSEDDLSIAGVGAANATTEGEYVWLQTWGPCRVSGISSTDFGGDFERLVLFRGNGCVVPATNASTTDSGRQIAGFLIERTCATIEALGADQHGGYNPFFMLQISP